MEKFKNKSSLVGSLVESVKIAAPLHGIVSVVMGGATISQAVGSDVNYLGYWAGFLALTQVVVSASTLAINYSEARKEAKNQREM